ncbi:MAG TPA: S53 family peptidase [Terracidiphilus sp.]|nr:S53 family peptidase [Terracidiphilus sp.]
MSNAKKINLKGTEQMILPGARAIGPTDPHQIIEISMILKNRRSLHSANENAHTMNHADFEREYGADPSHVDKAKQFARENNLQVLERGDEVLRRTLVLAGTAAAMEKAFQVELVEYEHENGTHRGYTGAAQLPEDLAQFVTGVFGLDDRPVANPHIRYRNHNGAFGTRGANLCCTPAQVAKLYGFPQDANGQGQTIALIELDGGYRPADIREYFQMQGLQAPRVKTVSVNHAHNRPSTANSADAQVTLDIEVAGSAAPGVGLVCYFAPNTARGFQDALSTAIHDQLNKPSVVCICWGKAEATWAAQSMSNFDQVAQEAAHLGITICVASGDKGSSDGMHDGKNHVDFPASCPHVLAMGGTRLIGSNGTVESETVWNDGAQNGATGGGYSTTFARPEWQGADVTETGRGVPDVACNADPETGYNILVDGQQIVVGGTSAAAPLWAGLIVLLNQKLNRHQGFINPALYAIDQSRGFRDITMGNNGAYTARFGWDPVCGLGSPLATQLLQALQGEGAAAIAQARRKETAQQHAVAAK